MPELRTPETVYPARWIAVPWYRRPGQGVLYDQAQISARGRCFCTHAHRPPGAKYIVFTRVVIAARGYLFSIFRYNRAQVSARGSLPGTHARRQSGAKYLVFTRVVMAARDYLLGMLRKERAQVSARGSLSGIHTRRPSGVKCPVFTCVAIAARSYVFGMHTLALRITTGEVSGGRVPIDI